MEELAKKIIEQVQNGASESDIIDILYVENRSLINNVIETLFNLKRVYIYPSEIDQVYGIDIEQDNLGNFVEWTEIRNVIRNLRKQNNL